MDILRLVTVRVAAALCLLAGWLLSGQAAGQLPDLEADQSALICEAGAELQGGSSSSATTRIPVNDPQHRQILIEVVARLDVDRDGQLGHRELQVLSPVTRRQLLQQFDANLDRQLSPEELLRQSPTPLNQEDNAASLALNQYPYRPEPTTAVPPQREAFQNLRRLGATRTPPTPRNQPFARAATFGSTANFYRPVTASSTGRSARAVGFSNFRANTGVFTITSRCGRP